MTTRAEAGDSYREAMFVGINTYRIRFWVLGLCDIVVTIALWTSSTEGSVVTAVRSVVGLLGRLGYQTASIWCHRREGEAGNVYARVCFDRPASLTWR